MLAELAKEAGIPDGVFNDVVTGGNDVGQALVEHPTCEVVATGSTPGLVRR